VFTYLKSAKTAGKGTTLVHYQFTYRPTPVDFLRTVTEDSNHLQMRAHKK